MPEPVRTTPVQSDLLKVATTTNDSRAIGEDFDDPDFDVMAEIDAICCEDLFDELRTDRAVRISKMEAKVSVHCCPLHSDFEPTLHAFSLNMCLDGEGCFRHRH